MDLFDPEFIRAKYDETLRGKPVFFGDSLDAIRGYVESNTGSSFVTGFDYDADREFCGFKVSASPYSWEFVYYDPLYEIKLAHKQGKRIQKKQGGEWENITNPSWSSDIEYRVAPEYRPYRDFNEFLADVEERFPSTRNRPGGTLPLVWVKPQQNQQAGHLITGYNTDCAGTVFVAGSSIYNCSTMFETFTYMDGTPFGKKE